MNILARQSLEVLGEAVLSWCSKIHIDFGAELRLLKIIFSFLENNLAGGQSAFVSEFIFSIFLLTKFKSWYDSIIKSFSAKKLLSSKAQLISFHGLFKCSPLRKC